MTKVGATIDQLSVLSREREVVDLPNLRPRRMRTLYSKTHLRHHGCQNGLLTSRHRSVDESPISRNWTSLSVARNARSLILASHFPSSAAHRLSNAEASERPLFAFVFIQVAAFPVK